MEKRAGRFDGVPVLERPGQNRIGRFGWKAQHASLLSFSADAYKNEMGFTSPLDDEENTSYGRSVERFDLPGVDDDGLDVELFALFMRDTKAPPRLASLAATSDAIIGEGIFNSIGCATCHTPRIVTAPPGTLINGGALRVANALGNKIIRPYGDFLLHDVGTATASCRMADRARATWCARRRCGACTRAAGSCMTAQASAWRTRSTVIATRAARPAMRTTRLARRAGIGC